jgi:hypothetical protein
MLDKERDELSFEYNELEQFLIGELKKFKYGELKKFCHENKISYHEVSRLRSGKAVKKAPYFLARILRGFGYKKVLITIDYRFKISRNTLNLF